MNDQHLSRKGFLRLCLLSAGASLAAACDRMLPLPSPTLANTSTAIPPPANIPPLSSPELTSGIMITGGDADGWTWNKQVRGRLVYPKICQNILVENGETRIQAILDGQDFSATLPLKAGQNQVIAICAHEDGLEEISHMITFTNRLHQRPTANITASLSGGRVHLDSGESRPDEVEKSPIREYRWSARPENPATVKVFHAGQEEGAFTSEVSGKGVEIAFPPVDGEYYFTLRVVDQAGREDRSTSYIAVTAGKPRIPDYDTENPAWVDRAIIYGVIPRLFGTPGAQAIQEKLDYLAGLGVTALWLAPVNATIDYGYSVIDYFELRENFGTKEDFHNLIQAAHDRGIRILMDFVPNHTSDQHPYFLDAQERGRDSYYWDFYDRDENDNYTYYFDWTHLPNLNYNNTEVRDMMIEAFSYWVREFDVDGFRVDACWGVKERRPDFWPEWRQELKRIKPDLLLLAEAGARDPYYFEEGFDAAYDWTDELGHWAWASFWGEQAPDVGTPQLIDQLKEALTNGEHGFHPDALIFRFLNNNDTGTRFITTHGEEMTRVATALLLTLPGLPCIYTGDEAGRWFRPYYDAAPISFKERYRGLHDYHQQLISLRRDTPSLYSRLWQLLSIEPPGQVLGYARYLKGNQQPVLVLLNFSGEDTDVQVALPEPFQEMLQESQWQDLLTGQLASVSSSNPIRARLSGYQALILQSASQS